MQTLKLITADDLTEYLAKIRKTSGNAIYFNAVGTQHTLWFNGVPVKRLRRARLLSFCDGWKARELFLEEPPSYRNMTVQSGVLYVLRQLKEIDIDYAGNPDRKEYRGFAALHDKMDANMLLPFTEEFDSEDIDLLTFYEQIMAGVTTYLCELWDSRYAHQKLSEKDKGSP